MSGRPINEDRQNAIDLGLRVYTGSKHSKCGTTQRYVSGGGCVHCARIIATEQREARKFLQRQATLDKPQGMVLEETDNAEARSRAAIEDLM